MSSAELSSFLISSQRDLPFGPLMSICLAEASLFSCEKYLKASWIKFICRELRPLCNEFIELRWLIAIRFGEMNAAEGRRSKASKTNRRTSCIERVNITIVSRSCAFYMIMMSLLLALPAASVVIGDVANRLTSPQTDLLCWLGSLSLLMLCLYNIEFNNNTSSLLTQHSTAAEHQSIGHRQRAAPTPKTSGSSHNDSIIFAQTTSCQWSQCRSVNPNHISGMEAGWPSGSCLVTEAPQKALAC
jgi:hypothetical protein